MLFIVVVFDEGKAWERHYGHGHVITNARLYGTFTSPKGTTSPLSTLARATVSVFEVNRRQGLDRIGWLKRRETASLRQSHAGIRSGPVSCEAAAQRKR